jgi:ABC-type multidrug transport system permease subunit
MNPLVALTRARVLQLVREPAILFWVFGFPLLIGVGLGIAFRNKPREAYRLALIGPAEHAALGRAAIAKAPGLELVGADEADAQQQLRTGKIDLIVAATSSRAFLYRYDPTQPKSSAARQTVDDALERAYGRSDVLAKKDEVFDQPGGRYIDFLIPGLLGLNLMGGSMWGIGYAVVDSRARKLMKRFRATPMRQWHYLMSFVLARMALLVTEVVALIGFGRAAFDVEVRGSYVDLAILSTLGALSFAGLALLVAARPSKVEVASGWMNLAMMPMWFLSGSIFSYTRFPEPVLPLLRLLPLTALNDGLRAVINDGAGLAATVPQIAVLAGWGVICFVAALKLFRWQ